MKDRDKKRDAVRHSIQDEPPTRLSDPSMKARIDIMRARLQKDPPFARRLLLDAGIVTSKGKLSKKSGG